MSSNYSGNAGAAQSPSPAPSLGYVPIVVLPSDGDPANGASVAQSLKVAADGLAFLSSEYKGRINPAFGDGSDGSATIASLTTLTSHMFYQDLTVNATLDTQGFYVRVAGTLTINAGGAIIDNGNGPAGNIAAAVSTSRAYNWVGKAGATGLNTASPGQSAASMADPGVFSPRFYMGGAGGRGGQASGGAAGGDGGIGSIRNFELLAALLSGHVVGETTLGNHVAQLLVGGLGGGSGATQDASNKGGGGGEGGGCVLICARRIVINGSHSGRAMSALGGNGGSSTTGANGGVGGGGGGGLVLVLCGSYSGEALASACVAGGAVGPVGVATSATAGDAGNFRVFVIP